MLREILRLTLGSLFVFAAVLLVNVYTKDYVLMADLKVLDLLFNLRALALTRATDVIIIKEDDKTSTLLHADGALLKRHHPKLLRELAGSGKVKVISFDHNFETVTEDDGAFATSLRANKRQIVIGAETSNLTISGAGTRRGYLDGIVSTKDGIERFVMVARKADAGGCAPSFGVEVVAAFYNLDTIRQLKCERREIRLGPGTRIPVDEENLMMINFLGRGSIPALSYVDIVTKGQPAMKDVLGGGDKIVVIGEESERYRIDLHYTPVGLMSGVELQAHIIQTVLHNRFIHRLPWEIVAGVVFMLSVLSCMVVSLARSIRWGIGAGVAIVVAMGFVSYMYFLLNTWNEVAIYSLDIGAAIICAGVLRVARILPAIELVSPYPELIEFVGASLLGLLSGHLPIWVAFGLAVFVPLGLLALRHVRRERRRGGGRGGDAGGEQGGSSDAGRVR